jgi:hypothetical protein
MTRVARTDFPGKMVIIGIEGFLLRRSNMFIASDP